jgi:DNA-binding Lrp family transcriptional regulator
MHEEKLIVVIRELLKNSRKSDREMAKNLGVSQPTVTRARTLLEKEGYVKTYTVIPDFAKLGYQIMAFTFVKLKSFPMREETHKLVEDATEWLSKRPNVIFSADGEGLGKDIVMISLHKSYAKYSDFMRAYAMDWGHVINMFESFTVSLESGFKIKPFDLKYLASDK